MAFSHPFYKRHVWLRLRRAPDLPGTRPGDTRATVTSCLGALFPQGRQHSEAVDWRGWLSGQLGPIVIFACPREGGDPGEPTIANAPVLDAR